MLVEVMKLLYSQVPFVTEVEVTGDREEEGPGSSGDLEDSSSEEETTQGISH